MENGSTGTCLVCQLGLIAFPEAMEIEHRLIKMRAEESIGDVLLIFEHPPTVTLGRFGKAENILVSKTELEQKGVALYDSDRGGDATFNCPGQLVVHPILNLHLRGARAYIGDLEEMVLRVLHGYGIAAEREKQHPGIWVKGKQIEAVGLHISRGVSMHGFSLNVNPDLSLFSLINLCGIPGRSATSMENELGREVSISEVNQRLQDAFSDTFGVTLSPISADELKRRCSETPA